MDAGIFALNFPNFGFSAVRITNIRICQKKIWMDTDGSGGKKTGRIRIAKRNFMAIFIWHYTVGKQPAKNILGASAKARLVALLSLCHFIVGNQPTRKHSICLCYERWVTSPYLVGYLVTTPWRLNQQRCLQQKKFMEF